MAAIKFSKQSIQPNPMEVDYWVDITSNPYGGNIKYFNGYDWVDLLNAKGKPVNLDAYYNKLQMNQMLSEKASVESVNSKVDDTEVADVIKNIEFKDRGDEGVEMVVLKYDGMTVGVTLPTASNTTSGIITNKSFKDLVKQNQLQGVYSEMYDKLSEIRQQYQRKLKAGKNIQIDENNTIHAVGEISLDWNDVYNKPDFDKLFATVALAIQSESNRAKAAEQQLSARITDHVDVVESKLDLKADANNVYTKDQIDEKISGIYKIKGSRTFQDLPTSGNSIGDVYNITNNFALDGVEYPLGTNVVYTTTGWDALAGIFDSTEIENKVDEIDTKVDEEVIRAKEKELELDKKFDDYLPLSGGTLNNNKNTALRINGSGTHSTIGFQVGTENKYGHLGVNDQGMWFVTNKDWVNAYVLLNTKNYSDYVLPLTGGTINGNIIVNSKNDTPLVLSGDTSTWVSFINKDGNQLGWFGVKYDRQPYFFNTASYKIWHEGNDGEGSGLDADTVDGLLGKNIAVFDSSIPAEDTTRYRHMGYGYAEKGWFGHGPALSFGANQSYYALMLVEYDNSRLVVRTYNFDKYTDWKTIAFTDSDITGNAASASYVKLLDKITTDSFYNYIGDYAKGITAFSNRTNQAIGNIGLYDTVLNVGSTGDRFFRLLSKKNGDLRYQTPVNNANAWGPERTIIDSENVAQHTKHFYDLTGGAFIPRDADLNDYTTAGTYRCTYNDIAVTILNSPTTDAFVLYVYYPNGVADYCQKQEIVNWINYKRWTRRHLTSADEWSDWQLTLDNLNTYNAPTATKATQDSEGNVITDTYALKSDLIIGLNITDGVYAVKTDGSLCTIDEADTSCTGVALIAGEHKFMIAKADATDGTNTTLYWSKNLKGKDVAGITDISSGEGHIGEGKKYGADFTTWSTGPVVDFNGAANTAAIIAGYTEHGVSMDARDMCTVLNTVNASDSYNDWYVPACGQLALMYLNMTEINAALAKIGGTALAAGNYWSSSENSSRYAWLVPFNNGYVNYDHKDYNYLVRFVRDIEIESPKSVKESITEIKDQLKQPATALKLANPIKLWGNDFDGSSGINGSMYTEIIKVMHPDGDQKMFIGNQYSVDNSKQGTVILTYDANPLRFYNNGNISMTINGSNNVGIGTDNPLYKLDVNGTSRFGSITVHNNSPLNWITSDGSIKTAMHLSNNNELIIGYGTSASEYNTRISGNKMYFLYGTSGNVGMVLNSSGNITIGGSDSAGTNYKLYVDGNGFIKNGLSVWGGLSSSSLINGGNIITGDLSVKQQITSGDLVDWYGVSWSENSSDPTCTRIGNMALHRSLPILNAMKGYAIANIRSATPELITPLTDNWDMKYFINSNDIYPFGKDLLGQEVFVKIPEFWYIDDYEPSTKTHNLKISQTAKAGWCHHKEAYVGAYEGFGHEEAGHNYRYRSCKNIIPTVSLSREILRQLARTNGYEGESKWNIYTYEEHRAICHLFLVEYATRNSQAPVNTTLTADGFKQGGLGSGCTTGTVTINGQTVYSFIPTGTTDSLGNGSGQVAYTVTLTDADGNETGTVTRYANRYRGIENPFGHIWKHVDDIVNVYNAETTYKTVYKCNKPEYFATNKNAKYKPLCSFPGGSKMQGWSKEIKATINCDFFKYSVGGSETTYWCDYNYDNDDTSEHCLLHGGNSDHGGGAGLFYFSLNCGVGDSSVSIGSRLTYLPWAE